MNLMRPTLIIVFAAVMGWSQPPATPPADETTRLKTQLERAQNTLKDWPNLGRYRNDNAALAAPAAGEKRVVFMGDSITDGLGRARGKFFPGKPYVNRGIGGQPTPQMLIPFYPDAVALKPKTPLSLAGT